MAGTYNQVQCGGVPSQRFNWAFVSATVSAKHVDPLSNLQKILQIQSFPNRRTLHLFFYTSYVYVHGVLSV